MSKKETRECKVHGMSEFRFYADKRAKEGGRWRCAKCLMDAVANRRKWLKKKAVEYKGGCCSVCGYSKSVSALHFHHLEPNEKDFGLSANGVTRSWERVRKELDKCILICANCHAELHEELYGKT